MSEFNHIDPPAGSGELTRREDHAVRLRRDLVRGSLWTLISSVAATPVTFAVNLIIVRSLGVRELGHYASFIAIVAIATAIANLGVSDATVQWLAAAHAQGKRLEETELIRRCAGFHVFIEGPVLALVVLVLLWSTSVPYAVAGAIGTFLVHFFGSASVVLTATARNALSARLSLMSGAVMQFAVAGTAASTHRAVPTYAFQALIVAVGPALSFVALDSQSRWPLLRPTLRPWFPRAFRRYSAATAVAAILTLIVFGRSELLVLQLFKETTAAGLFVVATGLASQITVPMDSLMAPLMPTSAGLIAIAPSRVQELLLRSLRVTALLGAYTMVLAVPAGLLLLPLAYGRQFSTGTPAFAFLAIASCAQSLSVPVTTMTQVLRLAQYIAAVNLFALIVDCAFAFSLIPWLGLAGAVSANIGAQIASLTMLAVLVCRRLHTSPRQFLKTISPFIVATLGSLAAEIISESLNLHGVCAFIASLAPMALLYIILFARPAMRLPGAEFEAIVGRLPRTLAGVARATSSVLPITYRRKLA